MRHHIQAFIGREELLRQIAQHYPTAVVIPLSQGFGMLPITEQFYDRLPNSQNPDIAVNRFLDLGSKLHQIGKAFSVKAPLAYVETEYFGVTGSQGSVVWANGQIIFGPANSAFYKAIATMNLTLSGSENTGTMKDGLKKWKSRNQICCSEAHNEYE
jgi:hypothetical protein